jgi:hypothetical protein
MDVHSRWQKLQYRQIQENIFQQATGASCKLHIGFKGMVNRLYNMIERDGLKDPFTGKPAVNFDRAPAISICFDTRSKSPK